ILISLVTVLSGFSELEEKNAVKNMARAQEIIANRLNEISVKISDWSAWDDLYYFIDDKNEAFRRSNLTYVTLESLKLDNMVFLDSKQNVVSSILNESFQASDANHQTVMPGLEKFFHNDNPFVSHELPQEVTDGIVVLPSGPTLLVSRPIVKSDFSGPINGTVFFARSLDNKELDSMGHLLQAKLEILRVDQISAGSNFEKAHKEFLDGKEFSIQPIDSEHISGFTRLREKTGRQDLILKVTMPRDIMQFGHHTLKVFIPALLFVGLCFALAVYLPLDREISKRLEIEKELLVLKNRFEQVSDFSREIIWEVDSRGMYTYLSRSVKDCLGYTSEELVNQRFFYDLHPEEGREEFKKNVFLIFSKKEPFFNLENCALTRDGRLVWLITNG
ncbi:MAG: CHASE4 domain-containing protein, partial [Candidatus Riflebacteria bacterium]